MAPYYGSSNDDLESPITSKRHHLVGLLTWLAIPLIAVGTLAIGILQSKNYLIVGGGMTLAIIVIIDISYLLYLKISKLWDEAGMEREEE